MRTNHSLKHATTSSTHTLGRVLHKATASFVLVVAMFSWMLECPVSNAATVQGTRTAPRTTPAPVVRSARRPTVAFRQPPQQVPAGEPVPFVVPPAEARPLDVPPDEPIEEFFDDNKPIGSVSADIQTSAGDLPRNYAAERLAVVEPIMQSSPAFSTAPQITYAWIAPGLCHRPLYFEEINLERHGYSWGILQPAASALHFGVNLGLLPYKMVVYPRKECIYTLGYYRPGSYAPFQRHRLPLRLDAAAVEGGIITGLILLIP